MKKILLLLVAILFGVLVAREWWFRSPSAEAQTVVVRIESGTGLARIADDLKDAGIIESPFLFKLYAKMIRAERRLQAGEFELASGMNDHAVLLRITDPTAAEIILTFQEGWTLEEMGVYLESKGVTTQAAWASAATPDLEGYLFPDTYRFLKGATADEIVKRMRANFETKAVLGLLDALEGGDLTKHQVLTLASIIEAEVQTPEDRRIVSGIFRQRLAIGMALQADSTVNYVTKKKDPSISAVDRNLDSPYNTYKVRGFPPGPIGNPGRDSIEAAAHPTPTDFYFFLTDADDGVHYATTLEEHNRNKAKYLR